MACMTYKILTYPDPFLRRPTEPWPCDDLFRFDEVWDDMEDTLEQSDNGAALSANQVGLSYRMFITNQLLLSRGSMARNITDEQRERLLSIPPVILNPKIVGHSVENEMVEEGCLSFPGIFMRVKRWKTIDVEYETVLHGMTPEPWRELKKLTQTHDGFWGQVFQHEIDHLDGRLFVDALTKAKRMEIVMTLKGGKK